MKTNIQSWRTFIIAALGLLSIAQGEQYEGVKGGRYQQRSSRPANETGLCYKRLPYAEAVQLNNATGHVQVLHPGAGQPGVKTSSHGTSGGWVTVIDCCEGYTRDATTGKCAVYCEGGCFGGVCAPGGICTCEPGWYPENGVCKPICRQPCRRDAYCFSPDVCACKYGYEETVDGECRPICPGGCENGDCIGYQMCRCKPGYVMNDNKKCESVCEGGCPHGECTKPGVCVCYSGYVNPPGETEACMPDCGPNACNGGECTSPGVCTCRPGYTLEYRTGNCVPDCPMGCPENGYCVAPSRCSCNPGYTLNQQTRKCMNPQITHGQTYQPGYESSYDLHGPGRGQTYNESRYDMHGPGRGQPGNEAPYDTRGPGGSQCDRPCLNGQCTGWNVCTCNTGYMPDPRDPTNSHCVAGCPGGCHNGVCSGPNFCICKPGYIKDRSVKGSQRCIPREEAY